MRTPRKPRSDPAGKLARNLTRCRRDARLSQEELAKRAGLNRTQVSHLENGKRVPRLDTLVKLAGGLGVEPEELLRGMAWTPAKTWKGSFRIEESD